MIRFGARVRFARFAARFGIPTPTRHDSPSFSSRAATVTMSSLGVMSIVTTSHGSEVHGHAHCGLRTEAGLLLLGDVLHVLRTIVDAVHPFLRVRHRRLVLLRDLVPLHVELVGPVVG